MMNNIHVAIIIFIFSLQGLVFSDNEEAIGISTECVNYKTNGPVEFSLNFENRCQYFNNSNFDVNDLENAFKKDSSLSSISFIQKVPSLNITDCCDTCFEDNECFIFRYFHYTSDCELFRQNDRSNFNFNMYGNDCYDIGLVTGK